jgi:catechol 2,3-dioxygenase-like lactoylglutathione lyase family enzyme
VATVRYLTPDVRAAAAFYVDRLGFAEREKAGPVIILERDGLELWLSGRGSSAAKELPAGVEAAGANRFVIRVDDLDSALAELRGAGVKTRDVVDGAVGRWVVVEDPAGNPIELFEPQR